MYRVSPLLFVTSEHIISDRAETSCSVSSFSSFSEAIDGLFSDSLSLGGSGIGEASELRGVELFPS